MLHFFNRVSATLVEPFTRSMKEARCRGDWPVLSGELMPLLELKWRLEGAFAWTTMNFGES